MDAGVSQLYSEEGQLWLRVSPGHSVSEQWLEEQAPDLYAQWWAAPSLSARDRLALDIERRLEAMESSKSWEQQARRHHHELPAGTPLRDWVARHEQAAAELGERPLDDRDRAAARREFQADGEALRLALASDGTGAARDELYRRLDAAAVVADRPFIEAVAGVSVDRLASSILAAASGQQTPTVSVARVRAEMAAEDPQAALRADVLLAVSAAGHDLTALRRQVARDGVDLAQVAPGLIPASEFYARHAGAIQARLDREIAGGGFRDLPHYMGTWGAARPRSASLHDTEHAVVEHVVGSLILASDVTGHDVREAGRMWQRAAERAELREWSAALERGDIELASARADSPERELALGLEVDEDHSVAFDSGQEVG